MPSDDEILLEKIRARRRSAGLPVGGEMQEQTAFDGVPEVHVEPPTEPGWYGYSGGRQTMTFLLRGAEYDPINGKSQWFVILENGEMKPCEWGYIEQALGVWDLVKLIPEYIKEK